MIVDIALGILLALAILIGISLLVWIIILVGSGFLWCLWRVCMAVQYVVKFMAGKDK